MAQDEDEHRLMALASKVPFDDRLCHNASEDDLNLMLIRDYLRKVHSNITDDEAIRMPFRDLCWSLQLIGGTTEYIRPKNFALLFFNDDPEKFIPYARIETVMFQDDIGDRFEEKIFHGPLHRQYDEVMGYLRSRVVSEKVIKVNNQAEAIRAFNYPYAALEEVVANAIYHKSYDDRNSYFLATIPIHPAFDPANAGMYQIVEEETKDKMSLKSDPISDPIGDPIGDNNLSSNSIGVNKSGPISGPINNKTRLIDYLYKHPRASVLEMQKAMELSRTSIKSIISQLKKDGVLTRVGSNRDVTWIVINKEN